MQPIVVQKYGGTSVADSEHIRRVAARIAETRKQGKLVVAVVSAMGQTTDELYAEARKISASPSRRELDMLLSCGERASMALLSMAVQELGYEAISFTGSQCGILTSDRHSGARIIEVRPVRVEDELARGKVVIVAGFQGVSYRREVTTLGRGGSDTTAVALAAALKAEYCEICSDVDGVASADPRIVSAAELLQAISHDEMLELAAHGARVLHTESVEFARASKIALYARRSTGSASGTRIDTVDRIDRVGGASLVRGVAGMKGLVRITGTGLADMAALLGELETWHVWTGDGRSIALAGLSDVPDWPAVQVRLEEAGLGVDEGWGAVTCVGTGAGSEPAYLAAVAAVGGERIASVSATPLRITAVCRDTHVDDLVRELHRALIENPPETR